MGREREREGERERERETERDRDRDRERERVGSEGDTLTTEHGTSRLNTCTVGSNTFFTYR